MTDTVRDSAGEGLGDAVASGTRRFALSRRDAHGLYRQFGFELVANPERQMEIMPRNSYLGPS